MRDIQRTQADIQKKQTDLIESQTEISRANHEPELRDVGISFGHRDRIKISLENIGNGIATNLALTCVLETENDYFVIEPTSNSLVEKEDSISDRKQSLEPGEKVEFTSVVLMNLRSSVFSDTRSWFTTATAKLHYTGTKSATVRLFVQYKNILGDVQSLEVVSAPFMVQGPTSIENALSSPMGPAAESMPNKSPNSFLDMEHLGQGQPPNQINEFNIDFRTLDRVIDYQLSLDIETPSDLGCEVEKDELIHKSFAEEQTVNFDGDTCHRLDHGDLVHIFATDGENRWQVDILGSGDYPPNGPKHASVIQRKMKLE